MKGSYSQRAPSLADSLTCGLSSFLVVKRLQDRALPLACLFAHGFVVFLGQ